MWCHLWFNCCCLYNWSQWKFVNVMIVSWLNSVVIYLHSTTLLYQQYMYRDAAATTIIYIYIQSINVITQYWFDEVNFTLNVNDLMVSSDWSLLLITSFTIIVHPSWSHILLVWEQELSLFLIISTLKIV
jgi:hypothetical protein